MRSSVAIEEMDPASLKTDHTEMETTNVWTLLKLMNGTQYLVFAAMFFGWCLEGMDFYLASITLSEVADTFEIPISRMAVATTLTLAMRPVGALLFGTLGDRFGRRWPLVANVAVCGLVSIGSAFAPNFTIFAILRSIFGIAMGGEWALSASMTMESLPKPCHGLFSGILHQAGPLGHIFAALLHLGVFPSLGWRPIYWIAAIPTVVIILMRVIIPESPEWLRQRSERMARQALEDNPSDTSSYFSSLWIDVIRYRKTALHMVALLASLAFVARSLTDLYPTVMRVQLQIPVNVTTAALISRDVGTMLGAVISGYLSQYIGRRTAMLGSIALALAFVPLFAIPQVGWQVILGAIIITTFIGGFQGVLAVFLHELGPSANRVLFMGLTTQCANLITGATAQIESILAEKWPRTARGTVNFTAIMGIVMAIFLCFTLAMLYFVKETAPKRTKAINEKMSK
ncbi:Carboxylic acid transporter [Dispira parvispora]|uniref:Carboxylic acid transporter n=1 Tax=Dispira parvispora TaxID=1520584 RepID=A0A9W8ASY3_9FUNG|nr:Carboxylic acid transporter [Dispira parvispora]